MLAQLKLDEAAKLEFSVAISGTAEPPEYRFVVELDMFSLMLKCRQVGEQIEVSIPPLKNITGAGDKDVRLEVLIDGKLFVPLKDVINFEPCIEIESKAKPVIKPEDMVKIGPVSVKKQPVTEEKDGYLVIKKG
jgi:hypothetical protein